ncbi:MAG TPA: hypothetical protein VK892_10390 [Pyrinomonadaceae bacterium]|nr:hypothetical protein [Pyrinomonadaceae bacterium]
MKRTISEKATAAINELNKSALVLARQMKSGSIDIPAADKAIESATRKVKTFRRAYFARTTATEHLMQIEEFHRSGLQEEIETANKRFGKVLKRYARTVGAEFQD